MEIRNAGENAIILYFGAVPGPETLAQVRRAVALLEREDALPLLDLIPSYASLVVVYRPELIARSKLRKIIKDILESTDIKIDNSGNLISLPAYYATESGADLEAVAVAAQLSVDDVIQLHSEREYLVYTVGFAPGFAYLGDVDPRLSLPRRATPRLSVPQGSIAIALTQTAVYPRTSPGGWHLIGRCPLPLFDPHRKPPMPIAVGDTVKFRPVSKREFVRLGGTL
ncbi:MAG: 5-oxoprolinase subunit PxpB [Porticoccaceae bacterium]